MNQTPEQWEKTKARDLIEELDRASGSKTPGPAELQDWNIRAQTLLTFAACRRLCSENQKS